MSAVYSDPVPLALSLVSFSAFSALLFRTCMQRVPAPRFYMPVACTALVISTASYAVEAIVKYAAPNSRKTFRSATPSGDEGNLPPASQQIIAICHAVTAISIQLYWTSWMLVIRPRSVAVPAFLATNAIAHAAILAVVAAGPGTTSTLLRPNAASPPMTQLVDFAALYRIILLLVAFFVLIVTRGRRLASIALVALVHPLFSDVLSPYLNRGSVPTLVVDAFAISSTIALVAVTVGIPKHGLKDGTSSQDVAYLVKPTRTTVYQPGTDAEDPSSLPFARRSSLFEIGNAGSNLAPRISIHPPTRHTTLDHPVARPLSTAVVAPSPPSTPRATHPKQERSLDAATDPLAYPSTQPHGGGCACPTCTAHGDYGRRPSGSNLGVKFAGDRASSEVAPLQVIAVESPTHSALAQAQANLPQAPPPVLAALPRPPSFSPPETLQHQYQQQQQHEQEHWSINLPAATPTYQTSVEAAAAASYPYHGDHSGYDDAEVVVIMSDDSGSDHDREPLGMLPSLGSRRPSGGATTLSINSRTSSLSRPMSPTTAAVAARLTRHLSEAGVPASPASTASFAMLGASTVGVDPVAVAVESEVGNRSRLSSMIDSQLMASEVTLADVGRLSAPNARQPGPPTSESVRAVVAGWPEYESAGTSPSGQQLEQHQPVHRGSIAALSSAQSSPTSAVTLFHSHSTIFNPPAPPSQAIPQIAAAASTADNTRDSLILPADALTVSVPVPPSSVMSSTSSVDRYVPMSEHHHHHPPPPFETVASMYRNSMSRAGNRHVSRTLSINGRSPMSSLSRRSSEAGSSVVATDPARVPLPDSDASSQSSSATPSPRPHRKSISSPPVRLSVNTSTLPPRQRTADSPYTASSLSRHSSEEADDLIIDPVALTRGSVMLAHSPRSSIMSSSSNDDFSGRRPSSSSAGSVPMSAISRTRTLSSASAAAAAAAAAAVVTAAGTPNNGVSPRKSSPLAVSEPRSLESQEPEPSSPLPSAPSNRASIMSGYQKFDSLTRGSMAWVSVPSGLQSPVSPVPPVRPPSDAKANVRGGAPAPAVTGQVLGSLKDQIIPSPSTGVEFATTPPEQRA